METQVETTKAVSTIGSTSVTRADELRDKARHFFNTMQKSWIHFAKICAQIRSEDLYKEYGYKSFKDFCAVEYSSVHFSTISKWIGAVDEFGAEIEHRMIKNPEYKVPAIESCYVLKTSRDKMQSNDYRKLSEQVLSGNLSYHALRSKLKDIKVNIDDFKKTEIELEDELTEDIKKAKPEDNDIEISDYGHDDITIATATDLSKLISNLTIKADYLTENLPMLIKLMEQDSSCITNETVDFGNTIQDLMIIVDDFLNKLEHLS